MKYHLTSGFIFLILSFTNSYGNTDIFPIEDVIACDMYILPQIEGTGLTSEVAYYSSPGGTGIQYQAGDTIFSSTILYAFDQDVMGFAEECFFIQIIVHLPDLSQLKNDTACAYYMLPYFATPGISGFAGYYTEPDKQGVRYAQGDTVFSSGTLYAFDGYETCSVEQEIHIIINDPPVFDEIPHQYGCHEYIFSLFPGDNIFPDSVSYIIANQSFQIGDITTASGDVELIAENGACMTRDTFFLSVIDKIDIDPPGDTLICGQYLVLPPIRGINVTENAKYYRMSDGTGMPYVPEGDYHTAGSPGLYAFDEIPGTVCRDEELFNINWVNEPKAYNDLTTTVCRGYQYNVYDLLLARNLERISNKIYSINNQVVLEPGDIFNTANYADGEYMFYVVDPGAFPCINDTAIMTVVVTSNCTNQDKNEIYCVQLHDIPLLLSTNITNDDNFVLGGYFLDENYNRILEWNQGYLLDPSTARQLRFYYLLEDADGSLDTSVILVDIVHQIELTQTASQTTLCKGECMTIKINFLDDDPYLTLFSLLSAEDPNIFNIGFVHDSLTREDEIVVCYSNTEALNNDQDPDTVYLPFANHEYNFRVWFIDNLKECQREPESVSLFTLEENTFFYNETLCTGEKVTIEGHTFDEQRPAGEILIDTPAKNGCDSFVYVKLSFYPPAHKIISEEICDRDTVIINCIAYTPEFSSDTQLLVGAGAYGCDSLVIIDLHFTESYSLMIDTILCKNQKLTIAGQEFSGAGNYSGIIKKENLCDSIIYDITIHNDAQEDINIALPMHLCEGDTGILTIDNNYQSVQWSTGETSNSIEIYLPGIYSVSTIDSFGCESDTSVFIAFDPGADLYGDFYYEGNINTPIHFNISTGSEIHSINWYPSSGLNCDTCLSPVATVAESQLYYFTAINHTGCVDTGSIFVHIQIDSERDVYIPTVFNPFSKTSENSRFGIFTKGGSKSYELSIFDRWGSLLYKSENLSSNNNLSGWDGKINNTILQSGVYVYRIILEGIDTPITGTITLIQ